MTVVLAINEGASVGLTALAAVLMFSAAVFQAYFAYRLMRVSERLERIERTRDSATVQLDRGSAVIKPHKVPVADRELGPSFSRWDGVQVWLDIANLGGKDAYVSQPGSGIGNESSRVEAILDGVAVPVEEARIVSIEASTATDFYQIFTERMDPRNLRLGSGEVRRVCIAILFDDVKSIVGFRLGLTVSPVIGESDRLQVEVVDPAYGAGRIVG